MAQPPAPRPGYRRLPEEAVDRIWFVMRAQRLGFTLEEIADLLELRLRPGDACGPAQEAAEAKFAEIDRTLDELGPVGRTGPSRGGGIL